MVAETRESVNKVFDAMTDGFRATMDSGIRAQQAWMNAFGDMYKNTNMCEPHFPQGDQFMREFGPFMGRNVETMTESFDTGFRAGMNAYKTACDATMKVGDADVYSRTRELWDAAFDAVRANFDAAGKAGKRTIENWSAFCSATCCDTAPKSGPKTTKQ